MLNTLRLVQGAVSEKDMVPVLSHFHIYDGRIQGTNGRLTIDAPIDTPKELTLTVPAARFIKAIDACRKEPVLIEEDHKLLIKAGRFKAMLPLSTDEFPIGGEPSGEEKPCDGLTAILRRLRPFVGDDATRLWACGILIRGGRAYATNNIILASCPAPKFTTDMVLPVQLIDELIRINDEPDMMLIDGSKVGFRWGKAWLAGKTLADEWPPVEDMLPDAPEEDIPQDLLDAVKRIMPFCPNPKFPVIQFGADGISTEDGDMSAEIAEWEFPEMKFHGEQLQLVLKVAKQMDLTKSPAPWAAAGITGLLSSPR